MKEQGIRWRQAAKAIGGLAATLTLLAHFWFPHLPLSAVRVELLLLLIGVLLGLDMITESLPVSLGGQENHKRNEDNENGD